MPTTLRLPDELKKRIAEVVKGTGKSAYAFILEAIERETRIAEKRRAFVEEALESREEVYQSGLAYEADEVHEYLRAKAAGRKVVQHPKAKCWRK
jgi:predicted transcriptional regulator